MIRNIIPASDPRLRKNSKPVKKVDKKVLSLITDLKETLAIQKDPEGVGLAAPQLGKNVRVFVVKTPKGIRAFINPKILSIAKEVTKKKKKVGSTGSARQIMEGCLSLINYYGPLKRPQKIKIKYLTEAGVEKTETFIGFTAQIIQHEIDHLNGVFFVDRLIKQKKILYELVNGEWEKVEI